MLLPIRTLCGKRERKDGTRLIFIQYCYSSDRRTLLNTEIAVPTKFWNRKYRRIALDLPHEFGDALHLNGELLRMVRLAEDVVSFALKNKVQDPVNFVKATFQPRFDLSLLEQQLEKPKVEIEKVNLDFFFQFDDYIASKKNKVSPGMLKVFNNTRNVLKDFETSRKKEIRFEEIDFNFYEELVDYLLFEHVQRRRKELIKGLKRSSAGKTIKQLRIFLRNRMRKKLIAAIDLEDFKILDEESDAIYLTEKDIRAIYQADLSEVPHLQKYRYLLVLGCQCGMRWSDFSTIDPAKDIRNKRMYKKQAKSDGWVVVPLRHESYQILSEIFKNKIPQISNPDFNYYIKEVGKKAGITELITFSYKKGNKDIVQTKRKYQWITSHTCRRSFCTNEFLAGTPAELIMKISGHKSLRDFYRYIRITPEQAALQIEKIWKQRKLENQDE